MKGIIKRCGLSSIATCSYIFSFGFILLIRVIVGRPLVYMHSDVTYRSILALSKTFESFIMLRRYLQSRRAETHYKLQTFTQHNNSQQTQD